MRAQITIRPIVSTKPQAALRKALAALNDQQIDFSDLSAADLDQIRELSALLNANTQGIEARARTEWIEQSLS